MVSDTPQLIAQLNDPDPALRLAAANALGESERISSHLLPVLGRSVKDDDRQVRLAAISSLLKIWQGLTGTMGEVFTPGDEIDHAFGPLSSALRSALNDQDKYVRISAAEALRDLYCTEREIFDVFVAAAADNDESLRRRAALALWLGVSDRRAQLMEVESEEGVEVLTRLLRDEASQVRNYAMRAISCVGPAAQSAVPVLLEVLADENEETRFNAALALANLQSSSDAAVEILTQALSTGDRLKRKAAAFALRSIGRTPKAAAPALMKGLKDREKRVRSRCAGALGKLGADANDDVIHALLEAERDDDPDVRLAIGRALAAIGKGRVADAQKRATNVGARDFFPLFGFTPEEIPGLIVMLQDPSSDARAMAATALGNLGVREAVPNLLSLLDDEDEDVRERAAKSLELMGVGGETKTDE